MTNCSNIGDISPFILNPIIEKCKSIDWTDKIYDRTEKPLLDGRMLLVYPFILRDKNSYTDNDKEILLASKPLFEWIRLMFPEHLLVRAELGGLPPGGTLKWHVDSNRTWNWHALCTKFHVPLTTNDGCGHLWENDEEHHMSVGHLYSFNHKTPHSAVNNGSEMRIHLSFTIMPESSWDDLVKTMLKMEDISDRLHYGRDLIV